MIDRVALCIDDATRLDPSLVGLAGESFESQAWLDVFVEGEDARTVLSNAGDVKHVWVVSSNDIEPINLAATLKADRSDIHVSLVQQEACGSVLSRAHNAAIDEVIEPSVFVRRYAELKGRNAAVLEAPVEAQVIESIRPRAGAHVAVRESGQVKALVPVAVQVSTFVMPVVSGSGGAGKSVVSVVGAHLAHSMGYRTLLLDYDLQFGDVALLSGIEDSVTIDEAFAHPDLIDHEIERSNGPVVLAAPSRLETAELVVRALPDRFDLIASKFDVVIANTGAAWAEQHAALLERSNAALFLVDQRASSVWACKHALELCSRCGIATGPFQYAVNRCAKNSPLTSIDASCALRGAPVFELKDGGSEVEEMLSSGSPRELIESGNEFCSSLEQLLAKLLPDGEHRSSRAADAPTGKGGGRRGRHVGRKWGRSRS